MASYINDNCICDYDNYNLFNVCGLYCRIIRTLRGGPCCETCNVSSSVTILCPSVTMKTYHRIHI